MAEARLRFDWDQTSQVLAALYNAHRPPGTSALRPDDFHPLPRPRPALPPAAKVPGGSLFRRLFVDRQAPTLR